MGITVSARLGTLRFQLLMALLTAGAGCSPQEDGDTTLSQVPGDKEATWQAVSLPGAYDYLAPDGSEIRELAKLRGASMAHFRLPGGETSQAVAHHTIEEFWYVTSGHGEMWLKDSRGREEVVLLEPGQSLALPPGTHFQFRSLGTEALNIIGVSVPPWPGEQEAYPVEGRWTSGGQMD